MKKLLLILLVLAAPLFIFADDIDDMASRMNSYFDEQETNADLMRQEIESLKGKVRGGDDIIFSLNGRIEKVLQINKEIMNQRDLFGQLIDDQVHGYKLELFKWHVLFYAACALIVLYIVARLLKKFGPPQVKLALFWLP